MFGRRKTLKKNILIFLDIDGVLNTTNALNTKYEVCDENVRALGELADKLRQQGYEPKVILTSTWRLGYDAEFANCSKQIQRLITKLKAVDIAISAKTPIYKEKTRDVEIMRYIREYPLKDRDFTYVILDDDMSIYDKTTLETMNFYKVNQRTGLTLKDVDKIIRQL